MSGSPTSDDDAGDDRLDRLADVYRVLADSEFRGYCPIYERLATSLADDPTPLGPFVASIERVGLFPVLLFACVHDLVLTADHPSTRDADPVAELAEIYAGSGADPWPTFRRVLTEHIDELTTLLQARSVQTNEVGRTTALLPALTAVACNVGQPLALVELGPSAGLNLFLDRYAVDYGNGRSCGPQDSPVRLACEVRGELEPPLGDRPPLISSRQGIDLNPLDITDDSDRRWLDACLWPGLDYRRAQMHSAIEITRHDPPILHRGSATELLPEVLAGVDPEAVPCVVSTWVLGYLTPEQRHCVLSIVDDVGSQRAIALVTGEYPGVADWLPAPALPAPTDGERGASLVGIRRWTDGTCSTASVAWMQAHGRWLGWIDEATAGGP